MKSSQPFCFLTPQPLTVLRSDDVTEGRGASCNQCQDTAFLPLGLPAQVILCDCCCIHGNEHLQIPSTRAPPTGLISMHGWGPSSSLIGPVSSWHGLWLTPAEDPAGCMPPSHHAHACCIPHDWTCPLGHGTHAPVQWMSEQECLTESHAAIAVFLCICPKC